MMGTTTPGVDASDALRTANEHVYRWPRWFGGFAAEVRLRSADGVGAGAVEVRPGAPMRADLEGLDAGDREWVREQLGSMVAHRMPVRSPEGVAHDAEVHDAPDGRGLLVSVRDPLRSRFRIEDGRFTGVERQVGGSRVEIAIRSRRGAPVGEVVRDMTVITRGGTGDEVATFEILRDEHVLVGDVLLPARRRSLLVDRRGGVARDLVLLGHSIAAPEDESPSGGVL